MQNQKTKTRKKLSKKRKKSQSSEPFGYQPNNPLTKYYAKFIESESKTKI